MYMWYEIIATYNTKKSFIWVFFATSVHLFTGPKIKYPTIHGKVQGMSALNYTREATVK